MLGNIVYAFNIYNLLRQLDVYTVITGECSGIATLLFFSAKKEKRYALPHTTITFTQPFYNDTQAGICNPKESIPNDKRINPYINTSINIIKDNLALKSSRLDRIFDREYMDHQCYDELETIGKMQIKSKFFKHLKIAKIICNIDELKETVKNIDKRDEYYNCDEDDITSIHYGTKEDEECYGGQP